MKFTAKQYAQALMDSLSDTSPAHQEKVLDNFVKVLAENNDLGQFEQIAEEFHKLELAKKGMKQLEVTTAHPITKENEREIIHELNKLVKGNFEIKKKLDEKLIGGVMVTLDDKLLDASVKNELDQLKKELTK
jgi:F-type H+-transporting ATPase subunit delta